MTVYLVGKAKLSLWQRLKELFSPTNFSLKELASLPTAFKSEIAIYFCFSPPQTEAIAKRLKKLREKGNLVVIIGEGKGIRDFYKEFLLFPSCSSPISFLNLAYGFSKWRERESYFASLSRELEKSSQRLKEELALASVIQNSLLPKAFPPDLPLAMSHKYIPHEYLGGDFFDIIRLDRDRLVLIIADVSGHGTSSALIAAMLKTSFSHAAPVCPSPQALFKAINQDFAFRLHTEHYITACYCIIDFKSCLISYSLAGHPPQFILRASGQLETIATNGFSLGVFEDISYEERQDSFSPGDRLILFTDGLIECPNQAGQPFGREQLQNLLNQNTSLTSEELSKQIIFRLLSYSGSERFTDDVTLLIIEFIPFL